MSNRVTPNPDEYDTPRAKRARARGLSAPYIPGGNDPNHETTKRQERFYLRILVAMVAVIVLGGFVLGLIASVLGR